MARKLLRGWRTSPTVFGHAHRRPPWLYPILCAWAWPVLSDAHRTSPKDSPLAYTPTLLSLLQLCTLRPLNSYPGALLRGRGQNLSCGDHIPTFQPKVYASLGSLSDSRCESRHTPISHLLARGQLYLLTFILRT